MKKHTPHFSLLMALNLFISITVSAQNSLPLGSWTFITDKQGNSYNSEKMVQGRNYSKAVFNFVSSSSYEFSLLVYDSLTGKSAQVTEAGNYSFTGNQFTLQPKASETVFGNGGTKSFGTSKVNNSLQSALYDWQLEGMKATKMASLVITPLRNGFREGEFSSRNAKAANPTSSIFRRKSGARAL